MVFKTITDDIIVQEGTFGFSFIASGTIYAGQLVKPAGPMQVQATTAGTDNSIGVAAYYVTKGEAVDIYGPGNIIRSLASGETAIGADLYAGHGGYFADDVTYGGTSPCVGIALQIAAGGAIAGSGQITVLLK
ncbi:MAG: hypothetical protein IMZ52_06875 [Actinobacteria bacterium]|nr:hypothetical protein [Actinomycetota bacterium]MBE3114592.1 hypothetical protein [Actinomycetota bacterium]